MSDSTPRAARRRRNAAVHVACAARLRVTQEAFAAQVDLERGVGRRGDDAVATAYLHLADPRFGCGVPGGSDPADPLVAAACRRGPHREHDADRRRSAALAGLGEGERWEDQVLAHYRYRLPVLHDPQVKDRARLRAIDPGDALIELRAERLREMALDSAARALFPDETRQGRRQRARWRARVMARHASTDSSQRPSSAEHEQMAFFGERWGDDA